MGRPPTWFTQMLIEHLADKYKVHAQLFDGDGDIAIIRALSGKDRPIVLSSDADFLTLCELDDLVLLSPVGPHTICKKSLLKEFNVTSKQIALAYMSSGCDNLTWKPKFFGFRTALKKVRQSNDIQEFQESVASCVDHSEKENVRSLFGEMEKVFSQFGWSGLL